MADIYSRFEKLKNASNILTAFIIVFIILDFLNPHYIKLPFFIYYISSVIIVSFFVIEIVKIRVKREIRSLAYPPKIVRSLENHEIEIILSIINKALDAKIGLEEFYSSWPVPQGNSYADELFSEVEGAIEHQPGNPFTHEIHLNEWKDSGDFERLVEIKEELQALLKKE